jgi:hypothetical protein
VLKMHSMTSQRHPDCKTSVQEDKLAFSDPASCQCASTLATLLLLKSSQLSMAPASESAAAEKGGRGYRLLPPREARYL